MGVESYLLRLRTPQCAPGPIAAFLQQSLKVVPDHDQSPLSPAYSHYVYRDGSHVIEYELFRVGDSTETSLRFALCNRPSIDRVFIEQAAALMAAFGSVATICEELPGGEPNNYNADALPRFATNCMWSINRSREYWSQMFGSERLPLSVAAAVQKFFYAEAVGAAADAEPLSWPTDLNENENPSTS
ncbi:MAG: hypothetical protein ACRC33_29395 [Gemmataceae bacterium]